MAKYTGHTITSDSALGDAKIQRSLKFTGEADDHYLERTPSSTGNRQICTFSCWTKRSNIGVSHCLASAYSANNDSDNISLTFRSLGSGNCEFRVVGYNYNFRITNRLFRDPSAWFHVVVAFDTTQSSADDRIKVYINGVQETSFSTSGNVTQNMNIAFNDTSVHRIGTQSNALSNTADGYIAEVNFIDGYQYDPSYFGFTDPVTNIWMPKRYEGVYGTNGYYLDFSDNSSTAALGIDRSPNGNDFAVNNIAVTDSMIDTPTNIFCTLNPLDAGTITESEGNLKVTRDAAHETIQGTMSMPSGKWYWEVYNGMPGGSTDGTLIGLGSNASSILNGHVGSTTTSWGYENTGLVWHNNNGTGSNASLANGDIFGIAYDADQGIIRFYKNGTLQNDGYTGITANDYMPQVSLYHSNSFLVANFGQDSSFAGNKTAQGKTDASGLGDFYYTPPTGYKALCSKNLSPTLIVRPQKHFETLEYTGQNTSSLYNVTGLEFTPDFVWAKTKNDTVGHVMIDTVRGDDRQIQGDVNDAEVLRGTPSYRFLKDGFAVSTGGNMNNPKNYAAYCWKAGGAAVSNTDGSITSSVSANQEAGFSICSFTINTSGVYTIGHGLGKAPDWIMMKNRDTTNNWDCYHSYIGNTKRFKLNSRDAGEDYTEPWNDTTPTSSVFTSTGSWLGGNGNKIIAYCWTSIPGYSKMGGYTGNGSSDGPFVHLGFRPAWLLIKADLSESWYLYDNKRDVDNEVNQEFRVDHEYASGTFALGDFLSNGFKIRGTDTNMNGNGSSYFYIAFADQSGPTPFDSFPNAR